MNKRVKIGEKWVGEGYPTFIIAEAGSNYNGDKTLAKELIDVAVEAGADAVKFQTYSAETLYSRKTPKFSKDDMKPYDLIKSIELPREWQSELAEYADKRGIYFMSTPFDYAAVDELEAIGVPAFKIASFTIVDLEFLKYVASKGKPMIISTGMASLGEIEDVLSTVKEVGNDDIVLLHCNSVYPTPVNIVNLRAMDTMRTAFKCPIGFSDHTLGITIPIAAVSRGANVIEKHFTLSRKMKGPDHSFALEPDELKEMVKGIREVESALGNGIKGRSEAEEEGYLKGRRSIIARRFIPKGTVITRDMLIIKRPGYGIKPKFIDIVVGREAKVDIEEDQWITWEMI